jgi:hypothetical protein
MTYRSHEAALRQRIEDLKAALDAAEDEERSLGERCAKVEERAKELEARLAVAGVGAGPSGARTDRIWLAVAVLCAVGALLVPIQYYIGGYVRRQPDETILPIMLLGVPGALAAIVAYPYRLQGRKYRIGVMAGTALALAALLNILIGFLR